MSAWTREELSQAFDNYLEVTRRCARESDWTDWSALFTDDVDYYSNGALQCKGRKAVQVGVVDYYSSYPLDHVQDFSLEWSLIDDASAELACALTIHMDDPGDGSLHVGQVMIRLRYAGNMHWAYEADYFCEDALTKMVQGWIEASTDG